MSCWAGGESLVHPQRHAREQPSRIGVAGDLPHDPPSPGRGTLRQLDGGAPLDPKPGRLPRTRDAEMPIFAVSRSPDPPGCCPARTTPRWLSRPQRRPAPWPTTTVRSGSHDCGPPISEQRSAHGCPPPAGRGGGSTPHASRPGVSRRPGRSLRHLPTIAGTSARVRHLAAPPTRTPRHPAGSPPTGRPEPQSATSADRHHRLHLRECRLPDPGHLRQLLHRLESPFCSR